MELMVRARLAVTEGEGVIAGLRKLEEETTFWQIRHCRAGRDGPSAHARPAEEKAKGPVAGWAERLGGPAGRWAKCEGKFFSE
jgi:hypothetical protein